LARYPGPIALAMQTGQLEGINNRIKVMKRMAYGYRDFDFSF
jgi:transposase